MILMPRTLTLVNPLNLIIKIITMKKFLKFETRIKTFNKILSIEGDKSLSIRWALLASNAVGKSTAYNLLNSEDVLNTLNCLKKLGIKIKLNKKRCEIIGNGLESFNYKRGISLDCGNSGTLARLILGLLVDTPHKIKITGDESLSKRDFSRITEPLKKFGITFFPSKGKYLPLEILGSNNLKPINYRENKGSAQCKSAVMLASLKTKGTTKIIAKKSRNHSELLFKFLQIPIIIKSKKNLDLIKIKGCNEFDSFNYRIPSDISSASFFIVLTLLSKDSRIILKNININPSRNGIIKILNRMGANIIIKNKKNYRGELIGDLFVKSKNNLIGITCPKKFNSAAIDEFLIIFLVAARAKGNSSFTDISELNMKESPRLKIASKVLNLMGIKNNLTKNSIKIFGNPNLEISKKIEIKDFKKDHRIFMMCAVAALTFGGKWKINDPISIKTSFPSFLKKLESLGAKFK